MSIPASLVVECFLDLAFFGEIERSLLLFFIGGTEMEISKQTAMSLIKVLCHYNSLTMMGSNYPVVENVNDILRDFEDFVLGFGEEDRTFADSFRTDGDVYPASLCEMSSADGHINNSCVGESGKDVNLSFKNVIHDDSGEIDTFLMIDKGRDSIGPITYIRMYDRELQVAVGQGDDRTWHYFDVEHVPSSWIRVLGQEEGYFRVVNWQ